MSADAPKLRLFLAGDVMTGRGIDQAMDHPVDPGLHEPFVRDARDYIELAEAENGPIHRPTPDDYIWGDALEVLEQSAPAARVVNLETAVTGGGEPWPNKGIHYRMHPANAGCLTAAGLDVCVLANNHLLDWGRSGLEDTLRSLNDRGLGYCGAGADIEQAMRPAAIPVPGGRLLLFACGHGSSGIPSGWAATGQRPGVWLLPDLSARTVERIAEAIAAERRSGDRVVVSVHIGGNWGYAVEPEQQRFARALIDIAGADLVHGHSSHHPKPLELHDGRLILHGCGDLINDYEGIGGHQAYRPDLAAMYFPELDPADGRLLRLEIVPVRIRNFRLERADAEAARWLAGLLNREGGTQAPSLDVTNAGTLVTG